MNCRTVIISVLLVISTVIMTGCATPPKKEEVKVFYPEAPALAHIQYLTFYTGSLEIEPDKSSFDVFLTGERKGSRLDKPYGVAMYNGRLYVCDTNRSVMIFDFQEKKFMPMQAATTGMGKVILPFNISIDRSGNKLVTDSAGLRVVMFDKNDFYVKAFAMDRAWKPVDAVFFEDKVYVADIKNFEIVVFDKGTGRVVKTFGQNKSKPEESLGLPTNLAIGEDGIIYVSDAGRFQVVKYDRDGHFRGAIGALGSESGHFARPRGIALDRANRLYVPDASFDNVQLFLPDGQLLLYFSKPGKGPGDLYLPAKVSIDYDNIKYFEQYVDPNFQVEYLIFITNQFGDRMVNVYAYGKEKGKKYPTEEELKHQLMERLKQLEKEKGQDGKDEKSTEGSGNK
ncbi:MAG: hypothetical protein HQL08_14585 [Nitrospirae bacterium]|nr:hypothetical protein [Nitrospirota bacterium]